MADMRGKMKKAREIRQLAVKAKLLQGVDGVREIARQLNADGVKCSASTVGKDIRIIEERMLEDVNPYAVEKWRVRHLAQLSQMEQAIALESIGIHAVPEETVDPETGEVVNTVRYVPASLSATLSAQEGRRSIMQDRAKLIGLNVPERLDVTVKDKLILIRDALAAAPCTGGEVPLDEPCTIFLPAGSNEPDTGGGQNTP